MFASSPTSAHGRHLGDGPTTVAAALYLESHDFAELRGVQLRGEVVPTASPAARTAYLERHPDVSAELSLTDLARRLGTNTRYLSRAFNEGLGSSFSELINRQRVEEAKRRLGADGEILLKAPNLMRGYHRSGEPGFDAEGWFHTGDLAVQHEGGLYELVGRSKELIISGGENIHPAEIEQLVAAQPGVADCAVVGLPDERWGEVPVLAVVPQPGATVDADALLAALAEQKFELLESKPDGEWVTFALQLA